MYKENKKYQSENKYNCGCCNYSDNSKNIYNNKKKSKCPNGAALGEIGSACGMNCNRACLLEN